MKKIKAIGMLLVVTMIGSLFSNTVLVKANDNQAKESGKAAELSQKVDSKIRSELTSKRGENTKYFVKEDGTYEAAVYPESIHYNENGQWKDIDNTLIEKNDKNKQSIENSQNNFKVKFAKEANSENLVEVSKDQYKVSWGLKESNAVKPKVTNPDKEKDKSLAYNDKVKQQSQITSTIEYKDVFDNINLQYILDSQHLKENFIIEKATDKSEFNFYLNVDNLIPQVSNDKSIIFYDKDNHKKEVFRINAPFMFDSNGNSSTNIEVNLVKKDAGYELYLKPNQEWLKNKDRKYPITIDPQIAVNGDQVTSTYIRSSVLGNALTYGDYTNLCVGQGYGDIYRTYIHFAIPQIPADASITNASLMLTANNSIPNMEVVAHMAGSFDQYSINWNNQSYISNIEDYQVMNNVGGLGWNITRAAKQWYSYGNRDWGNIMLEENPQKSINGICKFSKPSSYNPVVTVRYIVNSGLEDYWSYHSRSIDRAGTAYINDFNGETTLVHNDLGMSGNRMPLILNHVYNDADKAIDIGYGYGWRLSLSQRLTFPDSYNVNYIDEDGTTHILSVGSTTDGLLLTKNTDGTYAIKDKSNVELKFNSSGYLIQFLDSNGNKIILNYNGNILSTITDGAGRITTLQTDSSGRLISITDPSNRKTSYEYTSGNLTKIIYSDGKYSTYNYSGVLQSATNYDGKKITITKGGWDRASSIQETNVDGTVGEKLDIDYGYNTTTFTDSLGRKNTYQFNNSGNTINILDADNNGQFYKYYSGYNSNKLSVQSTLQKSIINLLKNHDLEALTDWAFSNASSSIATGEFTKEDKYYGGQSIKINKTNALGNSYYEQLTNLEKGKTYTLSAYTKTTSISNLSAQGANLLVNYKNNAGSWVSANSKYLNGTNGWNRQTVTFTVPADAATTDVSVRLVISGETGTAYFDSIQLEESKVENRYNLIENPSFELGSTGSNNWNIPNGVISTGEKAFGNKSIQFNCSYTETGYAYQDTNISGKAGDRFVFGGWAKAYSAPLMDSSGRDSYWPRAFSITAKLTKLDGTIQSQEVRFNDVCINWQYICDEIVAESDYSKISIYIDYSGNSNSAYFDGIQLYKEDIGTLYKYDSNGNLTSSSDANNSTDQYQYNTTNDLTQHTDANNNTSTNNYDNNHNLTSSTSAEGVITTNSYDSYGNKLSTKIGNDTLFVQSNNTYSTSGNYLKTSSDSLGNTTIYNYDETKGLLNSELDPKGQTTNYTYDGMDRITNVSKSVEGQTVNNSYSYQNDKLATITHNGFSYSFGYDSLGNNTTIQVGNQNLITNSYDNKTGRLDKVTYGNGQIISQIYDNSDRIVKKQYNGSDRFTYDYDGFGNRVAKVDIVNGVNYKYQYDLGNRLLRIIDSVGNATSFIYDGNSNNKGITEVIGGKTFDTAYQYDKDNRIKSIGYTRNSSNTVSYMYDSVGRITNNAISTGTATYNTSLGYATGINGSSSNLISSITNNNSKISYTYDKNGNIDTINDGGKLIKYYYNELDELKREDNQVLNKTIVYSYDTGGNILSKAEYPYTTGTVSAATKTYAYNYGDANWKDNLTSYDGNTITYDTIGNPLTYNGWTFTWEEGRQLKSMNGNSYNISYKYNDEGIRTEKNVNGVVTKYHLVDDRVTYESNGSDIIYYTYDDSNSLVSMNLNGIEYYYIKNVQGDIIGLFDKSGTQVVNYTYDSWGKLVTIGGTLASTVGVKNIYRYRGYRYDTETGLYYLQSRYYNPEWGRFINADAIVGEVGKIFTSNMFAYCKNNPINMADPDGDVAFVAGIYLIPGIGEVAIAATGAIILGGVVIWACGWLGRTIGSWVNQWGRAQVNQASRSIPSKLKSSENYVNLNKFNNKKPGGGPPTWVGPLGWYIQKDTAGHGGRVWKLFDWAGNRIASLAGDGKILGK